MNFTTIIQKAKQYGAIYSILLAGFLLLLIAYASFLLSKQGTSWAQYEIFMVKLLSLVTWTAFSIMYPIMISYRERTGGRNFIRDHQDFQRHYSELVRFFSEADPYRMDITSLPKTDWRDSEGVILGKVTDENGETRLVHRPSSGVGNLACFALPGGGKTTSEICTSALVFEGSVLAIDIKSDIYNFVGNKRPIKVFSPAQPEKSAHFNPLDGIQVLSPDEQRVFIERLSVVIIPDSGSKDGKYFEDGARDFFCGIALFCLHEDPTVSFPTLAKAIVGSDCFAWAPKIQRSSYMDAKSYTDSYIGSNEKNVAGAYGLLVKSCRPYALGTLADLLDGCGDCISPQTLEDGFDVYLEIPQDQIRLLAPVTSMIVQNFLTAFMRRQDRSSGKIIRPILFLLDEFPQLSIDYATLSAALSTLRSRAVSLFLCMQSISQLQEKYSDAGFRSIMDTCAYISVMSAQDPESRDWFSRLCGTKMVYKVSTSEGEKRISRTVTEERQPVFQPADFGNLGDDVVIIANGKYVRAQKTYCFK